MIKTLVHCFPIHNSIFFCILSCQTCLHAMRADDFFEAVFLNNFNKNYKSADDDVEKVDPSKNLVEVGLKVIKIFFSFKSKSGVMENQYYLSSWKVMHS